MQTSPQLSEQRHQNVPAATVPKTIHRREKGLAMQLISEQMRRCICLYGCVYVLGLMKSL